MNLSSENTLNALMGWAADKPPFETSLIEKCAIALATPIDDLSIEQLRLLISQKFGAEHSLDRAADILEANPMASGDLFEGDLLRACMRLPKEVWEQFPEAWMRIHQTFQTVEETAHELQEFVEETKEQAQEFYSYIGMKS